MNINMIKKNVALLFAIHVITVNICCKTDFANGHRRKKKHDKTFDRLFHWREMIGTVMELAQAY